MKKHLALSAVICLLSSVSIAQVITIKSGTTVHSSNSIITTNSSFINNGTFAQQNANLVLSGIDQKIGGSTNTNFDTLTIISDSVALLRNVTISNRLNLLRGRLSINNNQLTLSGTIAGTGFLKGSTLSDLNINGSGAFGNLYFDTSDNRISNSLRNFVIDRNGSVELVNKLFLKGEMTPTSGNLVSNGNLVVASESTGTARISDCSNFSFTGNVNVERYIPAKTARKWSFISSGVSGVNIRDGWQDEIFITGSGTGGSVCSVPHTNGFDATSANSPSIYVYDQTSAARWLSINGTINSNLEAGKGYRVLVRGDRNASNACLEQLNSASPPPPSAVTLSALGNLNTGDIPVTIYGGSKGYTLIGNPYACEIDFDSLQADNSNIIANKYWTYDPASYGTNYLTYSNGIVVGCPSGIIKCLSEINCNATKIASGQAFIVQRDTTTNATLVFKEKYKVSETQRGVFRGTATKKLVRIDLNTLGGGFIDDIVVRFSDDVAVTKAENKFDAITLNSGNLLASMKGSKSYSIQTRPATFITDTVPLRVNSSAGSYKLVFIEMAELLADKNIYLLDAFTGTQTALADQATYNFVITSDAASQGTNRFKLVFSSRVLPITWLSLSAEQRNAIHIKWSVASDEDIDLYKIQRSEDGRNFLTIGVVPSVKNRNMQSYAYDDKTPTPGKIYYRIMSLDGQGKESYSKIVEVNSSIEEMQIMPNPAVDYIRVYMPPQTVKAQVLITDASGRVLKRAASDFSSGVFSIKISDLRSGVYLIKIINGTGAAKLGRFLKE
jgi:hypothetical protein